MGHYHYKAVMLFILALGIYHDEQLMQKKKKKKNPSFLQCLQPSDSFFCVIPREGCVRASIPGVPHFQGLVSWSGVRGEGALCSVTAPMFIRRLGRTRGVIPVTVVRVSWLCPPPV